MHVANNKQTNKHSLASSLFRVHRVKPLSVSDHFNSKELGTWNYMGGQRLDQSMNIATHQ